MTSFLPFNMREEQRQFTESPYEFLMQRNEPMYVPNDQSRGWSECALRRIVDERTALIRRAFEVKLILLQYNSTHSVKIGSASEEKRVVMGQKEERELLAELDSLGFSWERTKNGHIKAVAPDGATFTFSTGGSYKAQLNQRSRLNRWKKASQPVEVEETVEELGSSDEWAMTILEEISPGEQFTFVDVANQTSLNTAQVRKAIEYLIDLEIIEQIGGGYVIPEEEEVSMALSPLAVAAFEAMVEAIRQESGDDTETYKLANEAFKSENAKLSREILDANGEMQILRNENKTKGNIIKARDEDIARLNEVIRKMQPAIDKRDERIKELEKEVEGLAADAKKFAEFKKMFLS